MTLSLPRAKARARVLVATPTPTATTSFGDLPVLADWLYCAHRGEAVRALEGLAAVAAARLARGAPLPALLAGRPELDRESSAYATARRIAARALAGSLPEPLARAQRVHPAGALPVWALEREPIAEAGGFVFYEEA